MHQKQQKDFDLIERNPVNQISLRPCLSEEYYVRNKKVKSLSVASEAEVASTSRGDLAMDIDPDSK